MRDVETVYVYNTANGTGEDAYMPFPCYADERADIVTGLRGIGFEVRDPFETEEG